MVPPGAALSLAGLNKVTGPDSGGIDARWFPVAHGLQLEVTANNAVASPKTITCLIKVENGMALEELERVRAQMSVGAIGSFRSERAISNTIRRLEQQEFEKEERKKDPR